MTSPYPFRAADISNLSELRSGGGLVGIRLLRDIVRSSPPSVLQRQAKQAVDRLVDEVSGVARNDRGPEGPREKAAEFIILLRAGLARARTISALVNCVAESAARARYRSGRVVDFLSTWLFICGEQFIAGLDDRSALLELEAAHPRLWNQARARILETLEVGSGRLSAGRRFRMAETYLTRFRLVRARNDERERTLSGGAGAWSAQRSPGEPDLVAAIVIDLFALSLSDLQQRLIVSQIPGPGSEFAPGQDDREYVRLWAPLRAVRTDQAFEHWPKVLAELPLHEHRAEQEFLNGLATHLRRTWNWFLPERAPFGQLRTALRKIEAAGMEIATAETDEQRVERVFRTYANTLSFIVRLATEDSESQVLDLEDDTSTGGVL